MKKILMTTAMVLGVVATTDAAMVPLTSRATAGNTAVVHASSRPIRAVQEAVLSAVPGIKASLEAAETAGYNAANSTFNYTTADLDVTEGSIPGLATIDGSSNPSVGNDGVITYTLKPSELYSGVTFADGFTLVFTPVVDNGLMVGWNCTSGNASRLRYRLEVTRCRSRRPNRSGSWLSYTEVFSCILLIAITKRPILRDGLFLTLNIGEICV